MQQVKITVNKIGDILMSLQSPLSYQAKIIVEIYSDGQLIPIAEIQQKLSAVFATAP